MAVAAVSLLTAVPASAAPRDPAPVVQTQAFAEPADADDPAIWVHPHDPSRSVVLGTLKEGGLAAFDLDARTLQLVPAGPGGRFNNVDVVGDLAVVSDRGRDRIRVYRIDPRGSAAGAGVLRDVTDPAAARVFPESEVDEQRTAYGLAAGRDPVTGIRWVAVTRRHETRVALLRLVDRPGGVGTARLATIDLPPSFRLPNGASWSPCEEPGERPQLEGSVLDGRTLYTAQEDVGIWRIPLSPAGFGRPELVDRVRSYGVPAHWDAVTEECVPDGAGPGFGGRWLTADAEGLAVAHGELFASSQGDSRFVVYGPRTRDLRIVAGRGTDSVEHSDGSAISTAYLGRRFPHGLLVVHDGERRPQVGDQAATGFAFVPLEQVIPR
ncbi:phytase [Amycolatopsis mongoliensis]|uniref:Phytase n=1 Tax=Amycolatopsis mongoliensis TaxID=715475 RepID=A0A9Y2NJF2_9PSEU|nr:phytase [Amycolatopsis sp. 4-36]WIY07457.1 phytase [Amycolatopsis sp. 4-36]